MRTVLMVEGKALSAADVAKRFNGANGEKVKQLLETLVMLGQARGVGEEKYEN